MSPGCEVIVPDRSKQLPLCNPVLINRRVTEDSHIFSWEGMVSLVLWYDLIPFYFRIFSISALTLTYYDAQCRHNASCKLHEPMQSHMLKCLTFVKSLLLTMPLFSNA